jgi:histidinol-phosphate aminotransferase
MCSLRLKPGISDISPYLGGESGITGTNRIIKLSSNESALGPSPKAVAAMEAASSDAFRYPDGSCVELRTALGKEHNLNPAQIVCGAGSDEIFSFLSRAYAGLGDEVIYNEHGFLMFPIVTRLVGAAPVKVPEKNLRADVDAFLEAVTDKTKILFLANPNNPTGSYLPVSELKRLRAGLPDHVLLVLDGAYAEFVTAADYSSGVELVDAGDNVVMTRTFSKIYGLGGVRLGWSYNPPEIADVLNRIRNPFNVSAVAQVAGLAALDDKDFIAQALNNNETLRAWTAAQLNNLGITVPPSVGNFILARFPLEEVRNAEAADTFLKSKGIIVRRMGGYGLPDSIRISIGTQEEMTMLVEALSQFMD